MVASEEPSSSSRVQFRCANGASAKDGNRNTCSTQRTTAIIEQKLNESADHSLEEKTFSLADRLFTAVDADGSGAISLSEFRKLHGAISAEAVDRHKIISRAKRTVRLLTFILVFMMIFLGISVALNFVVVDRVVRTTTEDGTLQDKQTGTTVKVASVDFEVPADVPALISPDSNAIIGTREEMLSMPLIVAPLLEVEDLAAIRRIVAEYDTRVPVPSPNLRYGNGTLKHRHAQYGNGTLNLRRPVTSVLNIIRTLRYNSTYVELLATSGETIVVLNGKAFIINGERTSFAKLCLTNASCSALRLHSDAEVKQLVARAWNELEEGGYVAPIAPPAPPARRRLDESPPLLSSDPYFIPESEEEKFSKIAYEYVATECGYRETYNIEIEWEWIRSKKSGKKAGTAMWATHYCRMEIQFDFQDINNLNGPFLKGHKLTYDTRESEQTVTGSNPVLPLATYDVKSDKSYGCVIPEFILCEAMNAAGAMDGGECSCTSYPKLAWDFNNQEWTEQCAGEEQSDISERNCKNTCEEYNWQLFVQNQVRADSRKNDIKISTANKTSNPARPAWESVDATGSGTGTQSARFLTHKKGRQHKRGGGCKVKNCATSSSDAPPCAPGACRGR